MGNAPKLDGQISLAEHHKTMAMAMVGYARELSAMRRQVDALAITLSRLSTGLTPEECREWAAQQTKEGGGK